MFLSFFISRETAVVAVEELNVKPAHQQPSRVVNHKSYNQGILLGYKLINLTFSNLNKSVTLTRWQWPMPLASVSQQGHLFCSKSPFTVLHKLCFLIRSSSIHNIYKAIKTMVIKSMKSSQNLIHEETLYTSYCRHVPARFTLCYAVCMQF